MGKKCNYRNLKWLWLSMLLMILDIGTKYWVKTHFLIGEVLSIFPGINFYYINNSGLAFGLFTNSHWYGRWVFVWISTIIIIAFIILLCQSISDSKCYSIAYAMVIGGALGNFFDRILYGTVIDFIDVYIESWHWPTFNIADVSICIGIIILTQKYYYDCKKIKF